MVEHRRHLQSQCCLLVVGSSPTHVWPSGSFCRCLLLGFSCPTFGCGNRDFFAVMPSGNQSAVSALAVSAALPSGVGTVISASAVFAVMPSGNQSAVSVLAAALPSGVGTVISASAVFAVNAFGQPSPLSPPSGFSCPTFGCGKCSLARLDA